MGKPDSGQLTAPADSTGPTTVPAAGHVSDGGTIGPRRLGEPVERPATWEAAWIDLGGEG